MFIFVGGVQPKTVTLDENPRLCPACGLARARLKRIDNYLSLFFIPLFRVGKGEEILICDACSAVSPPDEPFHTSERATPRSAEHPAAKDRGPTSRAPRDGTCGNCGHPIDPSYTYCPGCGRKL